MTSREEVEEQVRTMILDQMQTAFNGGDVEGYADTYAPQALIMTEPWDASGDFIDHVPEGFPGDVIAHDYVFNLFRSRDDFMGMLRGHGRSAGSSVGWRSEVDEVDVTALSPVMAVAIASGKRVSTTDESVIVRLAGVYVVRRVDGRWRVVTAGAGRGFDR